MDYRDLSAEQLEELAGKTPEELLAFAQEEGLELTDEQLEAVTGGGVVSWVPKDYDKSQVWKNLPTGSPH